MNSDSLLEAAKVAWLSGRSHYRHAMLEVGRLLHEFITERLLEADYLQALPGGEAKVGGAKLTRSKSVLDASSGLRVTRGKVNELLRVHAAVGLLSDRGEVGNLSYSSLRAFRVLICRRRFKRCGDGCVPSDREKWSVRSQSAVSLFRRAVADGWTSAKVIDVLKARNLDRQKSKELPKQQDAAYGLLEVARKAKAQDLADLLVKLISESEDPESVSKILSARLPVLRRRPKLILEV